LMTMASWPAAGGAGVWIGRWGGRAADGAEGPAPMATSAPAWARAAADVGSVARISTPPLTRRFETIRASGPRANRTCRKASRLVLPKKRLMFTQDYRL